MRVESALPDFLAFWGRAERRPAAEQAALWEELYARRWRAVLHEYDRWFAGMGSLEDALGRYGDVVAELEARVAALEIERGAAEVAALFGVEGPTRVVVFVGFFTADAWFDEGAGGGAAVFFAVEAGPTVRWHRIMALHEFAHFAHEQARSGRWEDEMPAVMLMAEGLAISTTLRLVPEAPAERHFGVEDHAGWSGACREAWPRAARDLLRCVERPDDRARRRFFWPDWGRDDHDVPERFGYFAAAEVLGALLESYDLATVARWPPERAVPEVRAALEALA